MEILGRIKNKVIEGKVDEVRQLTEEAIDQNIEIQRIINEGYVPGLDTIGERYSSGEIFLPEMLVAAKAVSEGMEIVKPLLTKSDLRSKGVVVLGTVQGDVHDIGKNLVGMMLEGGGFNVIDVGIDVPADQFISAAKDYHADIIGMSALLSTTRTNMKGIIEEIRTSEINNVKVMVGGASLSEEFAENIGADGYAPDAGLAVKKAKELLGVA